MAWLKSWVPVELERVREIPGGGGWLLAIHVIGLITWRVNTFKRVCRATISGHFKIKSTESLDRNIQSSVC